MYTTVKGFRLALAVSAVAVMIGTLGAHAATGDNATGNLIDTDGKSVGTVKLTQMPAGVLIELTAEGLSDGEHGFHIHETGNCDPDTAFKSAGGHFALDKKHGFMVEGGPHPGDMPNIHVPAGGRIDSEVFNPRISLNSDDEGYLMDDDGSAVMIHSGADDYESQPSGDAGDRVACAEIELQKSM